MLPFMDPFSCSSDIFLNSFLNIYSGIMLPSLPISILYGISTVVLPTCISRCAVISNRFLFRYTELILTVSIPSSWGSWHTSPFPTHALHGLSYSCIPSWSGLFSHIWCKFFHRAGHCLGAWLPPQYLHGCFWYTGCVVSLSWLPFGFWAILILSNFCDSVILFNMAACAHCTSTLLAHANTSLIVVCLLLSLAVSSLITSPHPT